MKIYQEKIKTPKKFWGVISKKLRPQKKFELGIFLIFKIKINTKKISI
jgi:hypothetical protein